MHQWEPLTPQNCGGRWTAHAFGVWGRLWEKSAWRAHPAQTDVQQSIRWQAPQIWEMLSDHGQKACAKPFSWICTPISDGPMLCAPVSLTGSRAARIQAVSYGTARAQIRAAFPRDASAPRHWEPCRRGVSQPEGLSSASSPRDSRQRHKTSGYLEGSSWLECWAWTRMESGHREGQFCQWAVLQALIPQLGNYPHSHLLFLLISSFLNNLLSLSPSTNGYKKQE